MFELIAVVMLVMAVLIVADLAATYQVGDTYPYATIQGAVDDIPGNMAGQGLHDVQVFAKAGPPVNVYSEDVNVITGFTNTGAADYIHIRSMVAHGGLSQAAGGTGILVDGDGVAAWIFYLVAYSRCSGFEIGETSNAVTDFGIRCGTANTADGIQVYNNIVHDMNGTIAAQAVWGISFGGAAAVNGLIYNNFVYNITKSAGDAGVQDRAVGIYLSNSRFNVYNNSVWRCTMTGPGNNHAHGIFCAGAAANSNIRNNYAGDGDDGDFTFAGAANSNNISSDATGNIINRPAVNQFTNLGVGTEDLHLIVGADCVDAGINLAPNVVDDIEGHARPEGPAYDVGGDEALVPQIDLTNISVGYTRFRNNAIGV